MNDPDTQLSKLERDFINRYQGDFPLQERPFKLAAKELDCSETTLIETVKNLKENKILTRFGPLFDAARLGGGLTLAAIAVPEDRYDTVTQMINTYPEVAHNYRREHKLNMWFVLATETPVEIAQIISSIETTTGLTVYNFPKLHEFYIGLRFDLLANNIHKTISFSDTTVSENAVSALKNPYDYEINRLDRKIIKQTQSGLPIIALPYHEIAKNIGCEVHDVISHLERMKVHGVIRRIGAVPNHFRLGFTANGMTVWDVPDNKIIELGNQIGQLDFVSHCYQRPRHLPLWPYNLFSMVHGHSRDAVQEKTEKIKQILGDNCQSHEILYSTAILKKTGLRLAA